MHAGEDFGMSFAGAALAIEAGILPWDREAVNAAIALSFEEFRTASGRPIDTRRIAKECLEAAHSDSQSTFHAGAGAPEAKAGSGPAIQ